MKSKHRRLPAWLATVLALAMGSVALGQAAAPTGPTREQEKAARAFARTAGAAATNEAKQALAAVMKAQMDRLKATDAKAFADAQLMAKFADTRANIDSTWITGSRNPEARKIAVQAAAYYGKQMLTQPVSPQTKINCLALLAELDEAPASGNGPPTPSAEAFPVLFGYAGDENAPAYLRAIALAGVNRHVGRWWSTPKWNDNAKKLIADTLTKVVDSKPKSELDVRSHAWLICRAYECLSTMASPVGAATALDNLADAKALPSVRMAALKYLSHLDASSWPEDKKMLYFVGLSHFIRSQLVTWYEYEEDLLQAQSGAGAAGVGGGYGGAGYGGGAGYAGGGAGYAGGAEGGGYAGGMGAGMAAGGYGGEGGGYGGAMGAASRPKPIDTQTWQVRLARRLVNQVSQATHVALDGVPLAEVAADPTVKPLKDAGWPEEVQTQVSQLSEFIDLFQAAVNDPLLVTNMSSLLTQAETNIEDIMVLVNDIPGFLERYPELADDEGLESADEMNAAPAAPADPNAPAEGGEAAVPGDPAEPAAAAPAGDATAANP